MLKDKPVKTLNANQFEGISTVSNFVKRCIIYDYNKQASECYTKPADYFITDLVEFVRHGLGKEKISDEQSYYFTCSDAFFKAYMGGLSKYFDHSIEIVSPFKIWNDEVILQCVQEYTKWLTDRLGYSESQIILIRNKMVNQYSDGRYLYYFDEQEYIWKMNQLLDKLYDTFEHFLPNCHIIDFPDGVYGDFFHKWGVFPLHFSADYYDYLYTCIDEICNRSLEKRSATTQIYKKYSSMFEQKIAQLKIANQQDSANPIGEKNYLIGDFSKKDIKDLSLFYGHNYKVSGEWKTINNSTFAFLRENSLILTDNGGTSHVQMNVAQTIKNCEQLAGKPVTLSVDARVLKRNDYGEGGLIAIANAMDYNKGIFYAKKFFHNLEWKRISLSITLPEKEHFKGVTIVLRALRGGWEQDPQHAIVEFANPKLEMGIEQTEPMVYNQTVVKDLTDGWNLNMCAVDEYFDSGIHEVENVFQICNAPSYTILFRSNGGSGNMDPIWGIYGEQVKLPKNIFVREGYRFIGWNGYRVSDSKYCYTKENERKYFKQGEQPAGWKLHFYKNECVVAKLSNRDKDTIIMEAQWEKIEDATLTGTDLFLDRLNSTIRGYEIAKRIIEKDPTTHYLIMHKHIGDAMRNLKYVILFKNYYSGEEPYHMFEKAGKAVPKRWVVKKVVVVTDSLLAGVAKLYSSVDDVIALSKEELNDLEIYAKSFACIHENLHRGEYGQNGDISSEQLKNTVFEVSSYNWVLDLPMNLPCQNDWILSSIKVNPNSVQAAKNLLEEHHSVADKTVVLCPYAKSSSIIPEKYWKVVIDWLKDQGYMVFTNTAPNEEALSGTIRLQIPVDVFCGLAALGCSFIGTQSGIVDILRWLSIDVKLVAISYLVKPLDYKFARNRKLEKPVERRSNTTHLLIKYEETEQFPDLVKKYFSYLVKGNLQKENYKNRLDKPEIWNFHGDLNSYIQKALQIPHAVLFLSVRDTANKFWNSFDIKKLGLEADLSEKWRQSYIAVVDTDGIIKHEGKRNNYRDIRYQFTFDDLEDKSENSLPLDNYAYLSSYAMGKGHYTKSAIIINGEQYSLNRRGLNIVVYSKEESRVIDSIVVDLWADPNLTVKREEDFK